MAVVGVVAAGAASCIQAFSSDTPQPFPRAEDLDIQPINGGNGVGIRPRRVVSKGAKAAKKESEVCNRHHTALTSQFSLVFAISRLEKLTPISSPDLTPRSLAQTIHRRRADPSLPSSMARRYPPRLHDSPAAAAVAATTPSATRPDSQATYP